MADDIVSITKTARSGWGKDQGHSKVVNLCPELL